jgi:hypothetical protein
MQAAEKTNADRGDGRLGLMLRSMSDLLRDQNIDEFLTAYIGCFSRNAGDVGQWRAYADDGRGCAIGFSRDFFAAEDPPDVPVDQRVFVGRVHYTARKYPPRLAGPLEVAADLFLAAVNEHRVQMANDRETGKAFIRDFATHVIAEPTLWNCLTSKHRGYRSEREVRLVMLGNPEHYKPFEQVRDRRGEPVRFVPYGFSPAKRVVKVVVGPAAPPGAEREVRDLVRQLGMTSTRVSRSDLPYRSFRG